MGRNGISLERYSFRGADLAQGLSFAEQVVSEANSVIVILDQNGNIQRFNRLSEEYTGLKEQGSYRAKRVQTVYEP